MTEGWKYKPAEDFGLTHAERVRSLKRESGLAELGVHLFWWTLVRAYLAVWHRLSVVGRNRLPKQPPYILVANHSSHLDAPSLMAPLGWRRRERTFAVAAGDTFFESVAVGTFAAFAMNALPLWRKHCDPNDVQEMRRRLLEQPCAYVLFPEGTRTRTGEMARFKRGIGMLVAGTTVPIVPCHLQGAFAALPAHKSLPRPRKLVLTVGTPLTFENVANDADGWIEIANRSEQAVRAISTPVAPAS